MLIQTKETLIQTLMEMLEEMPASKITVRRLCERADISRQALYNHYYGLVDLFRDALEKELERPFEGGDTWQVWYVGFEHALAVFAARRRMLLNLYHSAYKDDLLAIIRRLGRALVFRGISDCAHDMRLVIDRRDQEFMADFYMDCFMGVIDRLFAGGMTASPQWLGGRCHLMLDGHIHQALGRLREQGAARDADGQIQVSVISDDAGRTL